MMGKWYSVRCDRCGKPCGSTQDMTDTAAEARRLARRRGWKRIPRGRGEPGRDLCPNCHRFDVNDRLEQAMN